MKKDDNVGDGRYLPRRMFGQAMGELRKHHGRVGGTDLWWADKTCEAAATQLKH